MAQSKIYISNRFTRANVISFLGWCIRNSVKLVYTTSCILDWFMFVSKYYKAVA